MKNFLIITKILYFLFLFCLIIILTLFPGDEYWNLFSATFFWLIGIRYIIKILLRTISIDQIMGEGLIVFIVGIVVSTAGLFVLGEILLKLSFLMFGLGLISSIISYKLAINNGKT